MHTVGHHLQKKAVGAETHNKDAYARSAFNRYYYSAFLTIREMLASLDSSWTKLNHTSCSEVLNGKVLKQLKDARRRARKKNDRTLVKKINRAEWSVNELAKTISTAYGIRVVADYEQEEHVDFDETARFALRSVDVTVAHDWEKNTRTHCIIVKSVWDEIHA